MTTSFDVRRLPESTRTELAWTVHEHERFRLPILHAWNYDLCRRHRNGWDREFRNEAGDVVTEKVFDRPFPGCRECGIHFRKHQHVSIMWLYLRKNALLADTMGSGKTTSAGGLVAMLRETGELSFYKERGSQFGAKGRVIIVPRAPALRQWRAELLRMIPDLNILIAEGPRKDRRQRYAQEWEVLLIGPEMLREDHEYLERFDLALLLTDDIDTLRNPDTETYYRITRIGKRGDYGNDPTTDRFVVMTGTPLQKRLPELWAIFDAIAPGVLGGRESFMRRYVVRESVPKYDESSGKVKNEMVITGYKNTDELKRLIAPYYLRRTADDLDDVELPTILPNDIFLDLYPAQRAKYNELKKGVLEIIKAEGTQIKRPAALARLHYGSAICAGLASLGEEDAPRTSVKLDWVQEQILDGDLSDEKVVIFANLKNTVRALQNRLDRVGVGHVTVWGDERSPQKRFEAQERFWNDPTCRVLIGTKAIEQSLNLQVARHLINIDMILNPARMEQLAGRIRRDGSQYQHVYVHNLLTIRTQEEGYLPLLEREAALASHIWDDNSQLFNAISPLALLQLIGQSG